MCGITGIVSTSISPEERRRVLQRMNHALIHRGPDDGGEHHWQTLSLGQRRLSIIDTSRAGHQPIASEDESLWLVANGEIYNFKELRESLLQKGHNFCSKTDTETILHLYEEYGTECVHHLRGMFSFALLDKRKKTLFLARDRMGIKPLYYTHNACGLIFASEIRALLASGLVSANLNLAALDQYLSLGYVPPPATLIQDVHSLPPGHTLEWDGTRLNLRRYWDFPVPPHGPLPKPDDVLQELRGLLEESVSLHQVSDVPLGAFLSGGIDSSAVVGLMSRILSRPVKTFSIGFQDGPERLNELKYARIVAERFSTDHQEILIRGDDVRRELGNIVTAIDQPSFDGVNTYFISQIARQGGLTVALSGLGGDEIFGGYEIFKHLHPFGRLLPAWFALPRWTRMAASGLAPLLAAGKPRSAKLRRLAEARSTAEFYAAFRVQLGEDEKRSLYAPELWETITSDTDFQSATDRFQSILQGGSSNGNLWSTVSLLEMKNYMGWRLLRDTDAMSMVHSLEVRVPFVDHRIVEFVRSLPVGWERRWGYPKRLLVEALRDILPPEILNRPKQGFQFPMGTWMQTSLKPIVEETLSPAAVKKRGLFKPEAVGSLLDQFRRGQIPYETVWQFVILELWMQKWIP